jgi:hypothetical protein
MAKLGSIYTKPLSGHDKVSQWPFPDASFWNWSNWLAVQQSVRYHDNEKTRFAER